jgi:hypothetical protein
MSGRYEVYQIKEFCREVSVFGVGGNGVFEYGWNTTNATLIGCE